MPYKELFELAEKLKENINISQLFNYYLEINNFVGIHFLLIY